MGRKGLHSEGVGGGGMGGGGVGGGGGVSAVQMSQWPHPYVRISRSVASRAALESSLSMHGISVNNHLFLPDDHSRQRHMQNQAALATSTARTSTALLTASSSIRLISCSCSGVWARDANVGV